MSTLRAAAGQYLAMRRALGFKLDTQGRQLMSFIDFAVRRGQRYGTLPIDCETGVPLELLEGRDARPADSRASRPAAPGQD